MLKIQGNSNRLFLELEQFLIKRKKESTNERTGEIDKSPAAKDFYTVLDDNKFLPNSYTLEMNC